MSWVLTNHPILRPRRDHGPAAGDVEQKEENMADERERAGWGLLCVVAMTLAANRLTTAVTCD